jgi:hypothetical protein
MGMGMKDIFFTWKEQRYLVNESAVNLQYIVLPNRTVLEPTQWVASDDQFRPYRLLSATEVAHPFEHGPVGDIALYLGNAILAREDG